MFKSFYELSLESEKILEAAYINHYGILQTCEVGKKWVIKIKDKKVIKIDVDDNATRKIWELAFKELLENNYIKPHLDMYRVTEKGYLCVENK